MRRLVLVVAWMGATVIVTATAWAVVSAVEDRVSDRPLTPLIATTLAVDETTTTTLPPVTDPSAETPPPATGDEPTTTTVGAETDDTVASTGNTGGGTVPTTAAPTTTTTLVTTTTTVPTTTTTVATTTTTSTEPSGEWQTKTIVTPGGSLTIKHRPDEVVLTSTTPAAGFVVEIKNAGPPEVDVEFETNDDTVKIDVRVRYENGVLIEDIEEERS